MNVFRFIPGYEDEIYKAVIVPWAHVFYDEAKLERARVRFTRCLGQRVRNHVVAVLGGFPHRPAQS